MIRILVAEDDKNTSRMLCALLRLNGYDPVPAFDGEAALDKLAQEHIDLLLCDVMMPKMDGFEVTEAIRQSGSMLPILMLTAKDMPEDKKQGFLSGTDDYITKPPDQDELLLRIKALLRRARISEEQKIVIGQVVIDRETNTVTKGAQAVSLPPKEFALLYMLLSFPERTFTRDQLLDAVWGMDSFSDEKTVNVHVNRLRSRFEGWEEFEIRTVRGLGYRGVRRDEA